MTYIAKCDILSYSKGQEIPEEIVDKNQNLLAFVETEEESKPKSKFLDVNKDGKIDKKDFSIIAKALGRRGGKKKKRR